MHRFVATVSTALVCLFACTERPTSGAEQAVVTPSPVVIELFTSEGCSSCPPAEVLAAEINRIAREKRLPVYALEMHVDYWDRLGWEDPFGDERFTARQRRYARLLGSDRLYTPQMVVNGRTEFVGSDAKRARAAILTEIEAGPQIGLNLHVDRTGRSWQVRGQATGHDEGDIAVAALVLPNASSDVASGENAGRTLKHTNVVLDLAESRINSGAFQLSLDLPRGLNVRPEELSILCFLQQAATGRIIGAQEWVPTGE